MRPVSRILVMVILVFLVLTLTVHPIKAEKEGLVLTPMSVEGKKVFREKIIKDLVNRFREDQTFDKMHQYMLSKATELNKAQPRQLPEFLIEDTFSKTDNLFERTRFAIKDNPGRFYEPETFEKSVQKLLWLKGVCFMVIGIKEEHRMAFSYFYLPGNEELRCRFINEMVNYSFPEVPEIPENEVWRHQMNGAMSRLGYDIFSVRKFGIGNSTDESESINKHQRF